MKEELFWGFLSFQWFLAASASYLASESFQKAPGRSHAKGLQTTWSQLWSKIFFSFPGHFHPLQVKHLLFLFCFYTLINASFHFVRMKKYTYI